MVYSGKPSTGCYLCRRRKIKCDEAKPGCRNCYVYGKECPGYRPAIVFQNDTVPVQFRRWRTLVNKCKKLGTDGDGTDFNFSENTSLVSRPRYLADATWEDRALCYFFDQYTIPKKYDGAPGILESIPALYMLCRENEAAGSPSSCLRWSVNAVALSAFAREANAPHLDLQARKRYGMALHGLHVALSSPTEAAKDETLASILLLAIFEDINGERRGLQSSHTAGFELFVMFHSQRRLDGKYSRCLFHFAYTQLQIQILGLGNRPRIDIESLVELFDPSDPLQRLMCSVTKISHLVLNLNALCPLSERDVALTKAHILSCITYANTLDSELTRWCRDLPHEWLPRVVYSPGESLITYPDVPTGSLWNFYRSARIILQSIIQNMYETVASLPGEYPEDEVSRSTVDDIFSADVTPPDIIHDLISDICKSIPFTLGDVDSTGNPVQPASNSNYHSSGRTSRVRAIEGYELIWPLWGICTNKYATPRQKRQARDSLQRLGSILGIKLASRLADAVEPVDI
ncbi:hypothetical protein VTN77DRAFT_4836 [Rasamsonia byssochlamydoides]|uniref:uncharacterized protein n=1 Tax=Rasamsonia byssochlamydoides TaxID=89139 RepID=UPI003742B3C5